MRRRLWTLAPQEVELGLAGNWKVASSIPGSLNAVQFRLKKG